MQAYLVQHGEAKAEEEDPARPLTDRGQEEVQRVARHVAPAGLALGEVLHSGRLRARQTAEILAEYLRPSRGIREIEGMAPNDDPGRAKGALEAALEPIMLVGHLPHLGRLASALLVGDLGREVIRFRNGAIVCLVKAEGGWRLHWILTPELARGPSSPWMARARPRPQP